MYTAYIQLISSNNGHILTSCYPHSTLTSLTCKCCSSDRLAQALDCMPLLEQGVGERSAKGRHLLRSSEQQREKRRRHQALMREYNDV